MLQRYGSHATWSRLGGAPACAPIPGAAPPGSVSALHGASGMRPIGVGIIGTGWCGGIRAETCAAHPLVKSLHIAEIRPERLREIAGKTGARTATSDYRE